MDRMLDKRSAADWARAVLKGKDVVIIDTETTGLDPLAEACQIGIIDLAGNTLLDALVKPTIPISPGAANVTGISNETVANAPDYAAVFPEIKRLLHGVLVVTYNADYDRKILYNSGKARAVASFDLPTVIAWQCAMKAYAKFYGAWSDYHQSYTFQSLSKACRQLNLPVVGAHGAVADCRMTLSVIQAMAEWKSGAISIELDERDDWEFRDPEEGDR